VRSPRPPVEAEVAGPRRGQDAADCEPSSRPAWPPRFLWDSDRRSRCTTLPRRRRRVSASIPTASSAASSVSADR